ncbi:MAG: hypothetical protein JSU68_06750 [Phycisphaerales bacterium]|nr:MAG: hypothetical protein JSU68_06750 [Phycisphaerales bacterium]
MPQRRWGLLVTLAGTLTVLSACARPIETMDCWRKLPEPDPRSRADYVAWAQACGQRGVTDNAWGAYARLMASFPEPEAKEQLYVGYAVRWPWEEERFAAAAAWLDRAAASFELLREASQHEHLYAPLMPDGPYLLHVTSEKRNPIRKAVRGLAAAGWREFYRGDPKPLRQDALVMLRVAHHLDEAVTPTGRLGTGGFARSLYRDVLLQLLDRCEDPGAVAAELLEALCEADPPPPSLVRTVTMQYAALADMYQRVYRWDDAAGRYVMDRGEIDSVRSEFRRLRKLSDQEITEQLLPSDYEASIAFLKAHHEKLLEYVDQPYADIREVMDRLDGAVDRKGTYLTQTTVRKLRRFLIERNQVVAARRATHLIYALWTHRHARGTFPPSLDELDVTDLAELRRDAFSPRDFAYRLTAEGFTLYSLGIDMVDQGGRHAEDWGFEDGGDYVFWPMQPITPPWLRPRILITSDGRILEQPRDGGPVRELSPEEIGLTSQEEEESEPAQPTRKRAPSGETEEN